MPVHPIVRRFLAGLVVAVAVIAGTQLALGSAAQAHGTFEYCIGSSKVCTSIHSNGDGNYEIFTPPIGACWTITSFMNNNISSIDNHYSGVPVTFWKDASCNGAKFSVPASGQRLDLAGSGFNDTITSLCVGLTSGGGINGCDRWFP